MKSLFRGLAILASTAGMILILISNFSEPGDKPFEAIVVLIVAAAFLYGISTFFKDDNKK
ncbi:MAG: hypothetical protein IJR89_03545 [Clostridia bacterium]|nr:hypothetical protein [Clostridia bacterium]